MNKLWSNAEYKNWLAQVKAVIRSAQIRAVLSANAVLIDFYYDLGRMIALKETVWGGRLLANVSADLKKEFPDMQGFSVTNLKYCRLFYKYIESMSPQAGDETIRQNSPRAGDEIAEASFDLYPAIRQMPWGHIKGGFHQ
ncbi:MAG: DUF1016 family protein [Spartobacteria bacterium]|nr:DUF1016 family protein [Spartobacteria bacterium]